MNLQPNTLMSSWSMRSRDPVILFVDDEPEILSALRRCFRNEPYTIYTALSAAEGLQWLGRGPVDLVITDERMPEMPGTDFLREVRDRFPRTYRGILTGYRSETLVGHGLEAGADVFLYKPWEDRLLRQAVRSMLRKGPTGKGHSDAGEVSPQGSFDLGGEGG